MDFEDILNRYQEFLYWKRLVAITILAILPTVNDVYDNLGPLLEAKETAIKNISDLEVSLIEMLDKHKKVAKLEQSLAEKEQQMKEASKKLPETIYIDEVLQKVEIVAQQMGINMQLFEPGEGIPSETAFRYMKIPIHINISGSYGHIASFLDHLVHFDMIVNVENLQIQVEQKPINKKDNTEEESSRRNILLRSSFDMLLFRSLSPAEESILASVKSPQAGGAVNKAVQGGGTEGQEPAPSPQP